MVIRKRMVLIIGLAALAICTSALAATVEYDLTDDWSTAQNPFGRWSLRKSPTALFQTAQPDLWSDGSGQVAWADAAYDQTAHVPFWFKTTVVPPPAIVYTEDVQIGDLLAQSGEFDRTGTNVTSAVWTSPAEGTVSVSGAVWSVTTFNRATRWELRKNGLAFTSGELASDGTYSRSNPFSFPLGSDGPSALQQTVLVGDQIELVLQALTESGNVSDILGVDLHIALTHDAGVLSQVLFFDDFEGGGDPSWIQPNGGWICEDGHMRNTTTCGFQSCMPDIWSGGPQYTDYIASFDLNLSGGNLNVYVLANDPAEHEQGQTGAYAVDVGIGDGTCGGGISLTLPWPSCERLVSRADPAFCFDSGLVYRVKFGRIGPQVLYKAWPKSTAEPSSWMLSTTHDAHHSGYWGISFWNGMGWIDNFLVERVMPFRVEVEDIPNDEGSEIQVFWLKHPYDATDASTPVLSYDVQRFDSNWATLATLVATQADSYLVAVSTPDVLTIGQPEPFAEYRVVACTADTAIYFESLPDSGCSIDNLPPAAPSLDLFDSETDRSLVWQNPTPADFGETCLHRGEAPGFEAGDPLVCSATQFWYQETNLNRYWYRARSFDIHGNASEWSNEVVGRYPTDVPGAPAVLRLYPNQPNPFNPMTTLRFDLPVGGKVRLEVYDVAGRLIRTLLDADLPAGGHQAVWDGTDSGGRGMPSGSYFARLSAFGKVETVRMGLVR